MRRALLWSLLVVTLLVLVPAFVVILRVGGAAQLPAPDPLMSIGLPGGEVAPLSEVLARIAAERPAPIEPLLAANSDDGATEAEAAEAAGDFAEALYPGMTWTPLFKLAEHHRQAGRLEQALALYLSVPEDNRDYARAQRRIAWDILTRGQRSPRRAVPYVHAALFREPLDGNSWQDLARVYGATLGMDIRDLD